MSALVCALHSTVCCKVSLIEISGIDCRLYYEMCGASGRGAALMDLKIRVLYFVPCIPPYAINLALYGFQAMFVGFFRVYSTAGYYKVYRTLESYFRVYWATEGYFRVQDYR